jgi:hypothetical protein
MIKPALFSDSASGIRPASAFVIIGLVLSRDRRLGRAPGPSARRRRRRLHREQDRRPSTRSRSGKAGPLALFVAAARPGRFAERALAGAHAFAADRLDRAQRSAAASRATSSARRLIPDADHGSRALRGQRCPTRRRARSTAGSLTGALGAEPAKGRIEGMWVERGPKSWVLAWRPEVALSPKMRTLFVPRDDKNPLRWSRRIADGIARCLWGDQALADGDDERALDAQRQRVWSILMPTRYAVAVAPARRGARAGAVPAAERRWACFTADAHRARSRPLLSVRRAAPVRRLGLPRPRGRAGARARRDGARVVGGARARARPRAARAQRRAARDAHPGQRPRARRRAHDPASGVVVPRIPAASYTYERHTPARRREPRIEPRAYYLDSRPPAKRPSS